MPTKSRGMCFGKICQIKNKEKRIMKKGILFVLVMIFLAMTVTAHSAVVTPTIFANGNHFNQIWRPEYTAPTVGIQMTTDQKKPVDWWLVCLTPSGWKHYDLDGNWKDGLAVTYQGELFSFGQIALPVTGLDFSKPGTFTFYFEVDDRMNRERDGNIYSASVSVNVIPTDKLVAITIYDTFQAIGFDLSTGAVNGFVADGVVRSIALSEIESVMEVSDRVGWTGNSIATSVFDFSGVVWIPNTANNDKAQWVLKLKSGKIAWLNLDQAVFAGKTIVRTADDLIQYGAYHKQTIYFASGQAYIDFACNLTDGFVSHVNPADISYVRWNSDSAGWNDFSQTWGVLQVDAGGNYFVHITTGSVTGSGLFSVVLRNGSVVWMNKDSWILSGAKLVGDRIIVN